ncbi:CDP-diacylglycerol--glycerol-3-phosphate 3-phosphatidyltransferase [Vigna angularis]|uniref:CDP-diacylglycerol--glycerol-3-phosphate 1-phosphatidyltransferase n=3 Tax=Phaseolus angularis TaxID=3914 RepID=A0A8T0KMS0_PHAAN|nr:CDP-diacylglycerol--glycerol-3-phosphate 3-phosphatidyltransferase 2 [Vigna angularis]XP_017414582.1 CDP-diacylglycerol--glycerol-3-phosphate 3-phosphatidyltransferase 2 [Vigna angularis]XP_017414583.1 CDP-diacylglycerol--glycerol-3-phosphate 3-phosphatidyltransferase 2 [Vigna angularis]XP_017414584.1 CDP-diacylglycerol--glycerol-3-phosphate 3-phosphatidyltransferase 2 [Vigna angularis]XP_017414585.1 CDP-diacylglycerol--glycerol-3-phosphate 3-phosphatidyltransferase 2 [Vigna angularis]BAT93
MMSGFKLSTSAFIYVRTATKTKPLSWTPNTRTTPTQHRRRYIPSPSLSKNQILGFTRSHKLPCLGRASLVTDLGSPVPSPQPQPQPQLQAQSKPEPEPESSKLLTLPTILTLGRVAAVPLLVATFYMDGWLGTAATTSIFVAASITDWLDGYLARKMKLKSSFGAFLDPVADKLMVAATLVLLCTRPLDAGVFGQAPWLLTIPAIAIIGREITMSAVREWAASQDSKLLEAVAVNNLGKWKTASQMTALTILLATRDLSHGGGAVILVGSGVGLLYTSAGLALWSLVVYMKKIWRVLLR